MIAIFSVVAISGCEEEEDSDDDESSTGDDDDDNDNDDTTDDDDDNDDDDNDVTENRLDLVNPIIGTGGLGFGAGSLVPGPQKPNGMIRPSPDTGMGMLAPRFQHFAGYWYPDTHIRGFSQTRLVGTGAADLGNIRLMPVLGISNELVSDGGYISPYSKETEKASLGYYSVVTEKFGIKVELAAGDRVAIHRYTFPEKADNPYVVIDASASILYEDAPYAEVEIDPTKNEITGFVDMHGGLSGRFGGLPTYFVIKFDDNLIALGTFSDNVISPSQTAESGPDVGAYMGFSSSTKSKELLVKIAISYISIEQARQNMSSELPGFDFEAAVQNNKSAWSEKLNLIDIEGGTETQRRIFYTALYHAYMMPTLFTEKDGVYKGFDDNVHSVDGFTYYTDMSIWDTFRTLHPLMTLVDPARSRDFVVSLIKMYEQGGDLPRWPMGKGYTGCMLGTHADSVITEAYIKGITDFDAETAYAGMLRHASGPLPAGGHSGRSDMEHYIDLGYCAVDFENKAPSHTVEYAYDDFCVGVMAEQLGYAADAAVFYERSGNWENIWDPVTQFIRAKDSAGNWHTPFIPLWPFAEEYIEGSAWHWSWFVPHDVPGLIAAFGGIDPYLAKISTFFEEAEKGMDHFLPDLYYWHGNEPDIQTAYMFNEAGRPDLAAKWARWIMANKYRNGPAGLDGNDDGGTLSSWYVFSSLGFFPLNPCDGRYMIGSPLFDKAVLHLPGGDFTITAQNNSAENIYIQSATLNSTPLDVSWFHHDDVVNGGTLDLVMGPAPSDWAQIPD